MTLQLERRDQADETGVIETEGVTVLFTPPVSEDYWEYRVRVSDGQAVIGFGKFGTIGIGFAVEDGSWNTNLPYQVPAEQIAAHIDINRPKGLRRAKVIEAIRIIQAAAHADRGTDPADELPF